MIIFIIIIAIGIIISVVRSHENETERLEGKVEELEDKINNILNPYEYGDEDLDQEESKEVAGIGQATADALNLENEEDGKSEAIFIPGGPTKK